MRIVNWVPRWGVLHADQLKVRSAMKMMKHHNTTYPHLNNLDQGANVLDKVSNASNQP